MARWSFSVELWTFFIKGFFWLRFMSRMSSPKLFTSFAAWFAASRISDWNVLRRLYGAWNPWRRCLNFIKQDIIDTNVSTVLSFIVTTNYSPSGLLSSIYNNNQVLVPKFWNWLWIFNKLIRVRHIYFFCHPIYSLQFVDN